MTEKRFTSMVIGGITECRWDGCVVATIRLSLFPDIPQLNGYDVRFKANLREAVVGKLPHIRSTFRRLDDAIDEVEEACIIGWVRPEMEEPERPITRPRDEHIRVGN